MTDPFRDENDPARLDGSAPPALNRAVGRRVVLATLLSAPLAGCVRTAPACPTLPTSARHCQHRFCRYHHA